MGKAKPRSKSAAHSIGRTSSSSPNSKTAVEYSESQVSKMSNAEFGKHEEAISEAMQNGKFSYDISGGAR